MIQGLVMLSELFGLYCAREDLSEDGRSRSPARFFVSSAASSTDNTLRIWKE